MTNQARVTNCKHDWKYYDGCLGYESFLCRLCGVDVNDLNATRDPGITPFGELIHSYTRAQAIEDGVLVDLSDLAREAGFKMPLAVTAGVWAIIEPELMPPCQDWRGRAWDLLTILRLAIKRARDGTDRVDFAPLFVLKSSGAPEPVAMWAHCGPGDDFKPVITVMLPGED